jgi:UbiD family decarboxylase
LAGEAIRLVGTEMFGDKLRVPADAEIILEGFVPPNILESEGGFGEYTGYLGDSTLSPVFELRCITHRRDAIYHDYGSGLPDSLVPDNMLIEAKLLLMARQVSPKVLNVHVPVSGRRFHAYVSVGDIRPTTAHDILRALLQFRRVKMVVLVNDDIDIFAEQQILWALATRTQMHRDAIIVNDVEGSALDPALPPGTSRTAKMGIDATWSSRTRPRVNRVPDAALNTARQLIAPLAN